MEVAELGYINRLKFESLEEIEEFCQLFEAYAV